MEPVTRDQAEANGFAVFNRQPHLCIDIPKGNFTLTCRTHGGKKVTFAFQQYNDDGIHRCVDIKNHTTEKVTENGNNIHDLICFASGTNSFRATSDDKKPTTLVTLLLDPKYKA
jgi:hypothetical protein